MDALDEAGSRVHITNIEVPKILDLERQLEDIRELKNVVVKSKNMRKLPSFAMMKRIERNWL
jgi:ATP-dependent Clp protease ATP-binding subunit ClpC